MATERRKRKRRIRRSLMRRIVNTVNIGTTTSQRSENEIMGTW